MYNNEFDDPKTATRLGTDDNKIMVFLFIVTVFSFILFYLILGRTLPGWIILVFSIVVGAFSRFKYATYLKQKRRLKNEKLRIAPQENIDAERNKQIAEMKAREKNNVKD